jgi:FAD/FMN-containing dehydrogenase
MHYKSKRQLGKEAKIAAWAKIDPSVFKKTGISKQKATDFESAFQGDLVWPWDADYNKDRQQADLAFDEYPKLIAYCKSLDDVGASLQFAKDMNWKVTCRSGGHSTSGYSVMTGSVTIDMSRYFNQVNVDPINKLAVVGSGTNFDALDTALDQYGLHVPGGECGDVCVGGYSQGGGYGFTARQYGVNCDNIVEARVMMLDATGPHLVYASQNPDLLWALQGGTGNNYGVLIDVTYKLYSVGTMYGFTIKWTKPSDILTALMMIQNQYAKGAPDQLGFQAVLMIQAGDTAPSFQLSGIYNGPSAPKGKALISPLLQIGNPKFTPYSGTFRTLNNEILPEPNLPPNFNGIPPEVKESRYIAKPIDQTGWQNIINYFINQRPSWNVTNAVFFEYYGGKINRQPINTNAFIHRDTYMDIYVDSFWYNDTQKSDAENWLDGYMQLLDNYSDGHQYQNYPRRNTPNYQWAFWGDAIWTLAAAKTKYDPLHLLDFPMSATIPADRNDPVYQKVKKAAQKSRFPKRKIVYDKDYEKHKKLHAEIRKAVI